MFCTKCGKMLEEHSRFCTGCGNAVVSEVTQETQELESYPVESAETVEVQDAQRLEPYPVESAETVEVQETQGLKPYPVESAETVEVQETQELKPYPVESSGIEAVQKAQELKPYPVESAETGKSQNAQELNTYPVNTVQEMGTDRKSEKKSKTKWIAVAAILVVLLAGSALSYYLYQSNIAKKSEQAIAYLKKDKYEDAWEIYEKYNGKNDKFDKAVLAGLEERVTVTIDEYIAEQIDYKEVQERYEEYKEYGIRKLNKQIADAEYTVSKIYESRESYFQAQAEIIYDIWDYDWIISLYERVDKADTTYYPLARKAIEELEKEKETALEEDREREEEERVQRIREDALDEVWYASVDMDYARAIQILEDALFEIPGDTELQESLDYYRGLVEFSKKVPSITTKEFKKTYERDGVEVLRVSIEMPVLQGDSEAYASINSMFDFDEELLTKNMDTWAEEMMAELDEILPAPYEYDQSYAVTYNNNGIFSMTMIEYSYAGGAHGGVTKTPYTFDLRTGETLQLAELMAVRESEFAPLIIEGFNEVYMEEPESFWPDAAEIVEEYANDYSGLGYILNEDNIIIYFHPYELASYARGFVEIVIPYAGHEYMFKFLQDNIW